MDTSDPNVFKKRKKAYVLAILKPQGRLPDNESDEEDSPIFPKRKKTVSENQGEVRKPHKESVGPKPDLLQESVVNKLTVEQLKA